MLVPSSFPTTTAIPAVPANAPIVRAPGSREVSTAWLLAGDLDDAAAASALRAELGGMPQLLRILCDLIAARIERVVIRCGELDLSTYLADPRVAGRIVVERVAPTTGGVLLVRADRVYHRDLPRIVADTYRRGSARIAAIAGDDYDGVVAASAETARTLARHGTSAIAPLERDTAPPPYLGFCVPALDRARAERLLVSSLRKSADGLMARLLNRRLSLPVTRLLARTRVMPDHVTMVALLLALAGGAVIAQGGYAAGVIGWVLLELGSIVDGIDGELARLRFQFSRRGQWMDTIADDLANLAYASGVAISLAQAGVAWAIPIGAAACVAFAITQATQYYLIVCVYRSGDLAAIPWAFQSSEFLSRRPSGLARIGAALPKLLKRDFAVTVFLGLAVLGQLAAILAVFAGGAAVFFVVLFVQLWRNRASVAAARAACA